MSNFTLCRHLVELIENESSNCICMERIAECILNRLCIFICSCIYWRTANQKATARSTLKKFELDIQAKNSMKKKSTRNRNDKISLCHLSMARSTLHTFLYATPATTTEISCKFFQSMWTRKRCENSFSLWSIVDWLADCAFIRFMETQ